MRTSILPALLPLLLFPATATAKAKPKDAILLSAVQSLTLRANKQTSHRRVSSIPQLRCVSSPKVCALHPVDVMRCTNEGSSYGAEDVEWSCAASLPPELKLGSTDVICEGYAGPDDPYVLRGSCGVEYRLVLTDLGEEKFPEIANAGSGGWFSGWGPGGSRNREPLHNFDDKREQGSTIGAWLFAFIFFGVLLWIVLSAWRQATAPDGAARRRPRNGWFGGGGGGFDPGWGPGGGGGYGDYDPPPPYDKYGSSSQGGWRPGFWSGLASGAAAGYMAGNRGNRQQEYRDFYGRGSSGRGGWGSSAAGPSSSSWGSGSDSTSTSSSRYTSTGFGSTNRR
ncbi:hypothetical protein F5B22DRAFT_9797 [Xylaria bambusicola]|uniref:uncharacterized protein n=1 Tax=Xylaria bambusicola TaxID=326684 RepID=UPI002007EC2E|nr:uncharacterized protein F5B22DRAFT_9797 [Xylaria bambusicola]KAI0527902.1 hypothetical protein F5B22DRAFT_9797 [Xylaria bambusicola]